jgi:hypothetical protein
MLRGQTNVVFFSLETGCAEIMDRLVGRGLAWIGAAMAALPVRGERVL